MKKQLLPLVIMFLSAASLFAQSPQKMNYQALVRNAQGSPVASSTPVSVRFSIHDLTANGTVVFTETQDSLANTFGLINMQIGKVNSLSTVSWGTGDKYLQIEIDVNHSGTYVDMGTSQLISVPYALYAANSAAGPQGPTGAQGPQGPTGAAGGQGVTGNDGAVGPTGATGPAGAQGATGANGVQGPAGPTGNDGVQGPTGADGPQGPTGAAGVQGATGVDGAQGPAGPTGADGLQGTAGATGPQGPTGADGLQGPAGPTGAQGPVGATGPQGPAGTNGGGVPAGAVFYFAAATVPTGYLECNGQAVSRTTYSDLFAFIGTTYGGGDNSTTFNVPDLRGEFIRGYDDGRGVDAGRGMGSAQAATGIGDQVHQTVELYYDNPDSGLYGTFVVNSSGGLAGTNRAISYFKVRPRNVAMMPCIKY